MSRKGSFRQSGSRTAGVSRKAETTQANHWLWPVSDLPCLIPPFWGRNHKTAIWSTSTRPTGTTREDQHGQEGHPRLSRPTERLAQWQRHPAAYMQELHSQAHAGTWEGQPRRTAPDHSPHLPSHESTPHPQTGPARKPHPGRSPAPEPGPTERKPTSAAPPSEPLTSRQPAAPHRTSTATRHPHHSRLPRTQPQGNLSHAQPPQQPLPSPPPAGPTPAPGPAPGEPEPGRDHREAETNGNRT